MTPTTKTLLLIPLYATIGGACLVAALLGGPGLLALRAASAVVGVVMILVATNLTAAVAGYIEERDDGTSE